MVKILIFDDNPIPQKFSLPKTILNYIFIHVNGNQMKKLYKTCKYFYSKFGYILINDLTLTYNSGTSVVVVDKFVGKSGGFTFTFSQNHPLLECLTDIWLTNKLFIISVDRIFLSNFIHNKIALCTLKDLEINFQKLTKNEFKILTHSKTLESINLFDVKIMDEKNNNVEMSLVEIMKMLKHVKFISICPCNVVTNQTAQNLAKIKFETKIAGLRLLDLNKVLNAEAFCKFLKENCDSKSQIYIFYNSQIPEGIKQEFQKDVQRTFDSLKTAAVNKPMIRFTDSNYDF